MRALRAETPCQELANSKKIENRVREELDSFLYLICTS